MILHQSRILNPCMGAIIGPLKGKTALSPQLRTQLTTAQADLSCSCTSYCGTLCSWNSQSDHGRYSLCIDHYPFSHRFPVGLQWLRSRASSADIRRSIIIDYVPSKRLPKTRALFWWGLRAATLTVAVGLYEFETNDVGLTEAIKKIWKA